MGFNSRKEGGVSEVVRSSSTASDRAYVGSLLAYWSTWWIPDVRLTPDDFYDPICAIVFEAIKKLVMEKTIPELILVREKIVEAGKLESIGWNKAISALMDWDYNYHNLSRYEFAVKDNKRKREVEKLIQQLDWDDVKDASMLLKMGQQMIWLATASWWLSSSWISQESMEQLAQQIADNDWKTLFGFSFWDNFKFLDDATKWLRRGKTYRIGAPSNVGKSQLMYSVINNLLKQNAKIAFFTLENDMQTTLSFLMSNHQQVPNDKIMNGSISWDFDYLMKVKDNLTIIEDTFEINAIFSKVMELQPDIVVLDYIWLMSCKGFTDEQKFTEYAIQVQRFVKASQVCWMDLSNLPTQLQQVEDIKINPQFFGSTYLRNNTDVWIHITPNKSFYEMREKVMTGSTNHSDIEFYKFMSWVNISISKNRLWPHSINKEYLVDYSRWGKWELMTQDFISRLEMASV
jgi:replicative DNA helicase